MYLAADTCSEVHVALSPETQGLTMQRLIDHTSRPPLGGIVWGMVLNAIIPLLLYKLARRYLSPSEFIALGIATTFPLGKSIFDLARWGLPLTVLPYSLAVAHVCCWSANPYLPVRLACPVLSRYCCHVQ
jgi:hypothetical protein